MTTVSPSLIGLFSVMCTALLSLPSNPCDTCSPSTDNSFIVTRSFPSTCVFGNIITYNSSKSFVERYTISPVILYTSLFSIETSIVFEFLTSFIGSSGLQPEKRNTLDIETKNNNFLIQTPLYLISDALF